MTRVLVLGGTGWLSGLVAQRWLDAGAHVTCLSRGGVAPFGAEHVLADRSEPDALDAVAHQEWDEVVDVSSAPQQVEAAVAALGANAAHWSYVSSVSVYAGNEEVGAGESAPLAEPLRADEDYDYSRAKSAAESAVRALGDRAAIVRPGLIVGPGDPTDRFGYWPARFRCAVDGPVLVPEADVRVQVIDVADLAAFLVDCGRRRWAGAVNAIGRSVALREVLALVRELAGHTGPIVPATPEWLLGHDVAYWAGPRSLPLWVPADMPGFAARDGSAYLAAGGTIRPLAETIVRVLADEVERGLDRERRAGLSRAEELALIAELA